jgi:ATP-dependent RNA helicase RhlB
MPLYTKRQSMLFSATLSYRVMELAYEHMNLPEKISITPEKITVEQVEQVLYHVGKHEKLPLLLGILKKEQPVRTLIFVNTRRAAEMVVERLTRNGWKADAITGEIVQKKRLRLLEEFKDGRLPVLVATDVASRGIHVEGVTHVINYDLPQDAEDYVHRIGRTGRAGATGKALSLADEEYVFSLEDIEKFIGQKIPVKWAEDTMYIKEIRRTAEEKQRSAAIQQQNPSFRNRRLHSKARQH